MGEERKIKLKGPELGQYRPAYRNRSGNPNNLRTGAASQAAETDCPLWVINCRATKPEARLLYP
jgi:hypothetical protein